MVGFPDACPAAATPVRIQYYSAFIPMRFGFLTWTGLNASGPYYCWNPGFGPGDKQEPIYGIPPNALELESSGAGTWNIYLLCAGTNPQDSLSYPGDSLFSDVFDTLGIAGADFFHGLGPWAAIPRNEVDVSTCRNSSQNMAAHSG